MTAGVVSVVTVVIGTVVTVAIATYFSKNNLTHWQPMGYSQGSVLRLSRCFYSVQFSFVGLGEQGQSGIWQQGKVQ